ncbi:unnamed protein product [Orchesella dallaii]|uniref:Uncharacterized protein n=1 Tax=Orchesella dallaii TaxID=48710 RepID=A0ABP1S6U0_9HEXA
MDSMDSQTQVEVSPSKRQLPFRSYLIAQAAVENIFAVNEQLKFDNPVVYQPLMTKKVKAVRSHITSVLNYFSSLFDEFGTKIRKGREESDASDTTVLNPSKKRRKLDMNPNSLQSPGLPLPNELAGTTGFQQHLYTAPCGLEVPQHACRTMDHQFCSIPTSVEVTSSQGVSVVKIPN